MRCYGLDQIEYARGGDCPIAFLTGFVSAKGTSAHGTEWLDPGGGVSRNTSAPVSQICALTVLLSTLIERVANSTPMVDFESRLNSLRVNRERTAVVNMDKYYCCCDTERSSRVSQGCNVRLLQSHQRLSHWAANKRPRTISRLQSPQLAQPANGRKSPEGKIPWVSEGHTNLEEIIVAARLGHCRLWT